MADLDLTGLEIGAEEKPAEKAIEEKPEDKAEDKKADEKVPEGETKKDESAPVTDPKLQAAQAAEKNLSELMEKHGFASVEELQQAIKDGQDLRDMVGQRDLNQMIKDAETLQRYQEYWAEQKRQEQEQNEAPEETIERLKRENKEIADKAKQEEESKKAVTESQRALTDYNSEVDSVLKASEGLSDIERDLVKGLMGVDNPAMDVAITDKKGVTKIAKSHVQNVSKLIAGIKQAAIDEYARGKSALTPTKPKGSETPAKESVKVKRDPLPQNATVEDTFRRANEEFLELLIKGA
jgi:hypothetical protein